MKILLVWIVVAATGCLRVVEVLPDDGGAAGGECRPHRVAGYEAGFVCPLTDAGIRSIPANSSALRLFSVPTTTTTSRRSNLTLPPLAALRTLEVDVTHGGTLRSRSPFARFPDLVRLQLFHVPYSRTDDFRFALRAGTFEGCSQLRQLILPDLGIAELPVGTFRKLGNLRILELNHNRLTRIRNATFLDCCQHLSSLSLARNLIADLTLLSWTGLSGLRTLDLSSNLLSALSERGFEGLGNLVSVDLTQNRIHTIHPMAFAALGKLRELTLNENQLRGGLQRRSFQGLASLETLELSRNNITGDVGEVFGDLRSLTRLDLSQNRLQSLSPDYFETLSNLTDLGLRANRLTTLDPRFRRVFDRLLSLDLSSNPWNCDCRLLWLAEWLEYAGSEKPDLEIVDREDVRCSQPTGGMELSSFLNNATDCKDKHHPSTADSPLPLLSQPTRKPEEPEPEEESTSMTSTSGTLPSGVTEDIRTFCGLTTTEMAEIEKLKTLETLIESVTKNLKALDSLLLTTVSKIDTLNRLLTATIQTIETTDPESARTDNEAPINLRNKASNNTNTPPTRYVCITIITIVFVSFR